jgi:PPE-repeat protein
MTVPPPEVATNRAQLAMLVATNVIGQNTPAIAANEALYGEMWAQDAAAMYGYAGSSATASTVKAFTQPPETSNPAAQAMQGSAVTQANSASTGAGVQSQLQQLISNVPSSLQQLTSPMSAATTPQGWFGNFLDFLDGADGNSFGTFLNSSLVNGFVSAGYVSPAIITPAITSGLADINSLDPNVESAPGGAGVTGSITPTPAPLPTPAAVPNVGVSVNTTGSTLVGRLSVPPAWTAAAQVANHSGVTYAGGGWTNAVGPTGGGTGAGAVPAGMPGMPGAAGARSGGFGHGPRYGNRLTVMGRPLSGG